ncbi:hypothetical protein [Thermoplasma volcanium]|uniref:hypothetical protein n=1 Tax=Thermoplasma volcanium TaxID=50339 RepID=UPI00064F8BB1|nr:hypothetical protein [Thermoplasma volcanium]
MWGQYAGSIRCYQSSKNGARVLHYGAYGPIKPIVEKYTGSISNSTEVQDILDGIKTEPRIDLVPEDLSAFAPISVDMLEEHLKEKSDLMSPFEVE